MDLLGPIVQFTFGESGPNPQISSGRISIQRKLANVTDPSPRCFFFENWWVNIYHIPLVGRKAINPIFRVED